MLITNIGSYAAGARPSNECCIDDGLFEVTVIKNLRQWVALHLTRFMRSGLPQTVLFARQRQVSRLELHLTGSTCFQADGELYEGFPEPGQPLVIEPDGTIIVGHTRYRAAQKLGLKKVPVHVATDLTPAQIKAYRIADNKTAELA